MTGLAENAATSSGAQFAACSNRNENEWDFERAQKILYNCRIAMGGLEKRLLIIEKILPKEPDGSFLVDSDLIGLSLGDGRERNEAEFCMLAQHSGFEIENIKPKSTGVSIIMLRPLVLSDKKTQ